MKIALVTDTHFNARNDSMIFHDYFARFYNEVFFPYIDQHKIKTIVHLGDAFDRRKYMNYQSLDSCRKYFFDNIDKRQIPTYMIIGNHDSYYSNTIKVNSPALLLEKYKTITLIEEPQDVVIGKKTIAMLPWICQENHQQTMDYIKNTKADVAFGHLELQGFQMYRGAVIDHGLDHKLLQNFDLVASGHFHHKSSKDNIHYLGAPYQITWSDFDDPRGFHVFDTNTNKLKHLENPFQMFAKIFYDDQHTEHLVSDYSSYKGMYIKVVVINKDDPTKFDQFISNLEKVGVADLQVVEDHLNIDIKTDQEISELDQDTITTIKNYINDELQVLSQYKTGLTQLIENLYIKAIECD